MTDDEYRLDWLKRFGKAVDDEDSLARLLLLREARTKPHMAGCLDGIEFFALSRLDGAKAALKAFQEITTKVAVVASVQTSEIPPAPADALRMKSANLPVVAVLTVIGPELDAMKKALGIKEGDRVPGGGLLSYSKQIKNTFFGQMNVQLHVLGEAGNNSSAVDSSRIVASKVKFMLLCGIAAGIRDKVKIGDVIVPRAVVDNTIKVAEGGDMKPRPKITGPLKGVFQMTAAAAVNPQDWHKLFAKTFGDTITPPPGQEADYAAHVAGKPSLHDSAILSDNILLRDPQVAITAANDLHQQIKSGEMEAAGFVQACMSAHPPVPWYIIRGISDFGDKLKDDKFHKYASSAVAAYAAIFLKKVLDLRIWENESGASPSNN